MYHDGATFYASYREVVAINRTIPVHGLEYDGENALYRLTIQENGKEYMVTEDTYFIFQKKTYQNQTFLLYS